ncbi:MAG: TlpA family protein disulfide reductase [Acidobacteriaceae bacterium]|nr:TlpA family protein disulfide reductase [Acidobacteriaceae bacterium]MBV9764619.1 TlpA family protein disulfide reductase [Acidobacteriaceae bacterium]
MKQTIGILAGIALAAASLFAADANTLRKAPELAFTIPEQGQKLLSQYRGKVIALEFILTTCPHCQAASRVMTKMQQEYGGRGFQALDVAINTSDEQLVQAFAKNFEVGFPVGYTPQDQMMAFMGFTMADRFVVPQLIFIDRKGFIHYQTPPLGEANALKEETISQRIEELLALSSSAARRNSATARVATAKTQP